ncbi:MAG: hypothetical protein KH295_02755 [Clostridiaceae bacterium]|nr:hypothetical protein [Clostridiaceae bacterium]
MSKKGFRQRSFAEPGCIGCDAHLDFGLSRYCAGFKNKKRRKAFRKSDPAYKAPKWCPKRKSPCEYRIYSYADAQAAALARALSVDEMRGELAFPMAYRYRLRAEGKTGLTPALFFENANSSKEDSLFEGETIGQGDVVEIDTGLAQFFFYCAASHDFRPAFFDAKRVQKTAADSKEVC